MEKQIEIEGEIRGPEKVGSKKFAKQFIKFLKKKGYSFTGEIFDGNHVESIRENEKAGDTSLIL